MAPHRSRATGIIGAALLLGASSLAVVGGQPAALAQTALPSPVANPVAPHQRTHQGKQSLLTAVASRLGLPEQRVADAFVQARAGLLAQHLATALSLNADQIKTGLQQGKTVAQALADQGKSRDAARAALLAARHTQLSQAVQKGRLTADQATQREQAFGQHVDQLLDRSLKV